MPLLHLLEHLAFWVRYAPVILALGQWALATWIGALPGSLVPLPWLESGAPGPAGAPKVAGE
ncbi:MAG: hypothetical protein ACKO3N_17695 [Verrucomicrobiota bacterium]